MKNPQIITILCPKSTIISNSSSSSLQWLISSPFFPKITVISAVRCIHFQPSDHTAVHISRESDDLRSLIIRGFHVIGAVVPAENGVVLQSRAKHAINLARELRKALYGAEEVDLVGGVAESSDGEEVSFFVSKFGEIDDVEGVEEVVYETKAKAEEFVWERGCLMTCGIGVKLPVYVNPSNEEDAIQKYLREHEGLVNKFKDHQATYIVTSLKGSSEDRPRPVVIRGSELDFKTDTFDVKMSPDSVTERDERPLSCSYFCSGSKDHLSGVDAENAGTIQVTPFLNKSLVKSQQFNAPVAEYCPATEAVKLMFVHYNLDVICYAAKDLPLTFAISRLIIPALIDQLTTMKSIVTPSFLSQHPQLTPYHFCPPGLLHPITAVYELSYGETELKQVEVRRSLHLRLGLPTNRPLLRVANALSFSKSSISEKGSTRKGYPLLKDVHSSIPSSGVSGGLVSLVQGSYEYHHYLQGGFDDSGWGCAYRSLQTIISWFRLQHYTSVDVPTHREIQEALVEIGDKDPSFIGSREWIGAIELSYVLDKLLGVTCKVMTLRSGAEFPERCRELALHFENQGTPVMIGGGVLAYTLLGVDYNDATGDCAFLILDPHYTGGEDIKKIVNCGWCGWKKAVDNKGKSFFLADKFYNLLLPQRPNMV
ncbi:hypothetical protein vseg_003995 [Gypsophila vaccaria]